METKEILKLKNVSPIDKLMLIAIRDNYVEVWDMGCNLTAGQLGKEIGISRAKALDSLWALDELDLISCEVDGSTRSRITKFTKRIKPITNGDKKQLIIN